MTPLIGSISKTFAILGPLWLLLLLVCIQKQLAGQPLEESFVEVPVDEAKLGMYYVNVSLGSPPQNFRLLLNTGSADSWVYSSLMSLQSTCGMDTGRAGGYKATGSQWAHSDGRRGEIYYGNSAYVRGQMGEDLLTIGGLQVANFTFLEVSLCSGDYLSQVEVDGVLGLAGSLRQLPAQTDLIQLAHQQRRLNAPVFALELGHQHNKWLLLGERESSSSSSRQQDSALFVPTSGAEHWKIMVRLELQEAAGPDGEVWPPVNEQILRSSIDEARPALLDSSTNFIVLPSILAFIVNRHIGANYLSMEPTEYDGQLAFANCSLEGKPTVVFAAADADQRTPLKFAITPEDYVIRIENPLVDANYSCISAFMIHRDRLDDQIIFGNIILTKYSTIFDSLNESVGFRAH